MSRKVRSLADEAGSAHRRKGPPHACTTCWQTAVPSACPVRLGGGTRDLWASPTCNAKMPLEE